MRVSVALRVVAVECPVCGDPLFEDGPCPRCVALNKLFEAKRLADEERMRFLRDLPRTNVGVVSIDELNELDDHDEVVSVEAMFVAVTVISPFIWWAMWHFGRMAIAYLLKAGW